LNTFIDRCSSSLAVEDEAKPLPLLSRHTLEPEADDALALANLLQMAPSRWLPASIADLPPVSAVAAALGSPTHALLMLALLQKRCSAAARETPQGSLKISASRKLEAQREVWFDSRRP
jgi:hypothetical protein